MVDCTAVNLLAHHNQMMSYEQHCRMLTDVKHAIPDGGLLIVQQTTFTALDSRDYYHTVYTYHLQSTSNSGHTGSWLSLLLVIIPFQDQYSNAGEHAPRTGLPLC